MLRHRLVRAVLAEIPYGDAQCLALHLVAGLNQAEVAQALGIRGSAARKHIVLGLDVFAQRYESALAELGIPLEMGYTDLEPADAEASALASGVAEGPEAAATPPVLIETTMVPAGEAEMPAAVTASPVASDKGPARTAEWEDTAAIAAAGVADDRTEPGRAVDVPVRAGVGGLPGEDVGKPPFLVEPPLWQPPELADGALEPPTGRVASSLGVAAIVLDASIAASTTETSASAHEGASRGMAGAVVVAPSAWPPLKSPPIGPIVETSVVAASPEGLPQDMTRDAATVLGYKSASVPSAPTTVVPVLSMPGTMSRAAGARTRQAAERASLDTARRRGQCDDDSAARRARAHAGYMMSAPTLVEDCERRSAH